MSDGGFVSGNGGTPNRLPIFHFENVVGSFHDGILNSRVHERNRIQTMVR